MRINWKELICKLWFHKPDNKWPTTHCERCGAVWSPVPGRWLERTDR